MKGLLMILLCTYAVSCATAQTVTVAEIVIYGNHKTKEKIIRRELVFGTGDTLIQWQLGPLLERSRNNLLNTGLFTEVEVNIALWDTQHNYVIVDVAVEEAWYIYPLPLFELADRNFNVWWTEQNRSLDRINLGLRLLIINVGGVNDRLKFKGQIGYTPKFEFTYQIPFINREQSLGLEINVLRSTQKEIALSTIDNKELFVEKNDEIIYKQNRLRLGVVYRPNLYISHRSQIFYHHNWLDEELAADGNPDYFLGGRNIQKYLSMDYQFTYDHRNVAIYPTDGWYVNCDVRKEGLGFFDDHSSLFITPAVEKYAPISRRLSLGIQLKWQLALDRNKQPYNNYRALGFNNNYLRGYEYYVIDGLDFYYAKNTLSFAVYEREIRWKKKMPIEEFRNMPFRVILSTYFDVGKTNEPFYPDTNNFTNRWLYGGGAGINIMLYNLFVFKVEYSLNHLGEKGIFLHSNTAF